MKRFVIWAIVAASALLGGCASVTGGSGQKMYVQAQGLDGTLLNGAECVLSNDKGSWRLRTPGDTAVVRSNRAMDVRCEKAPLPAGSLLVESGIRPAMYGNMIIGGVVGAVIDHSSGAAYEYPEQVRVVMGQANNMPWVSGGPKGPPPTNFAALSDERAVPYLGPRGREAYKEWTTKPNPKAFAVAPNGHYFTANSTNPSDKSLPSDPIERAVKGCERSAQVPCKLYAVNDSVVWVKEAAPAVAQPAAQAAPQPVQPVASVQAPQVVQPVPVVQPVRPAVQPQRIATGYAALDDVDAVPYLSDRGRADYADYLARPTPKAFAISPRGHWFKAWSLTPQDTTLPSDPTERALVGCERAAKMPCKLYAVNASVVWVKE